MGRGGGILGSALVRGRSRGLIHYNDSRRDDDCVASPVLRTSANPEGDFGMHDRTAVLAIVVRERPERWRSWSSRDPPHPPIPLCVCGIFHSP